LNRIIPHVFEKELLESCVPEAGFSQNRKTSSLQEEEVKRIISSTTLEILG
jgi:hypothetical protein